MVISGQCCFALSLANCRLVAHKFLLLLRGDGDYDQRIKACEWTKQQVGVISNDFHRNATCNFRLSPPTGRPPARTTSTRCPFTNSRPNSQWTASSGNNIQRKTGQLETTSGADVCRMILYLLTRDYWGLSVRSDRANKRRGETTGSRGCFCLLSLLLLMLFCSLLIN